MSVSPQQPEKQLDELVASEQVLISSDEEIGEPQLPAHESPQASAHDMTHSMQMVKKCNSQWDMMAGSDTIRQCGTCRLLVVKTQDLSEDNLSRMLYEKADFLRSCDTNPLSALQDARKNGLFRRVDGAITIGNCYAKRVPKPITVRIWAALPFAPAVFGYVFAPGYILPMLNHPMARLLIVVLMAWHLIGCWLLSRTSNMLLQILTVLIFMAPLGLWFMVGPAVITILQALGPVMYQ
jgi:hypothetical protein